ncbi:MAG TPA: nuclear transport factor 2 family protein [Acidimicrobiales bacterium]|nr:nuclear transport factor 2 family protein [Acidimicrobiales bacterium]
MPRVSARQRTLIDTWEAHTSAEFESRDADAAIATMTDRPVLIHVPVGTGATGREPLRKFYREVFIPQVPPDTSLNLLSRTVASDRLIDEFILEFTHTVQIDWLIPGVAPTGQRVAVPHVAVIAFDGDKIASEHIYWDQASVLAQLGIIDLSLPILGGDQSARLLDANARANRLIEELGQR